MDVKSTARAAHEHGYSVVLAENLISTFTAEMQHFACKEISLV
ncbi:isochorismatase family protein [Gluconobacter wancherniae]